MAVNNKKDPLDVLGSIYEKLYEDSVSAFEQAEEKTAHTLSALIDQSAELISEAEEVSREQINEVSNYLKRDIKEAADFLSENEKELGDWLGFELKLLENNIIEKLFDAVDPTTLNLLQLKEQASHLHTGQVTGPGSIACDACDEILHYYKAGRIPPCPKCHNTEFHRAK